MRIVSLKGDVLLLVLANRLNLPHQKQDIVFSNARDRLIEQVSNKIYAKDLILISRYFIPGNTKEKLSKKSPQEILQEIVERFSWSVPDFVCGTTLVSIMLNLVGCAAYQSLSEKESFRFPIERLELFKPGQYDQDLCFAKDLAWVYMVFESRNHHSIFKPLFKVLGRKITYGLAVNYLHLERFFEASRPILYLIFNLLQIECQKIGDSSEKIFWMLITDDYNQSDNAMRSFASEEQTRFAIIQALHALQKLERHEQVKKLQQNLAKLSFVRLVMDGFNEGLQNVGNDILSRRAIIAHLVLQRPRYHPGFFLRITRQYVLSIFETSRLNGSQPDSAFQLAAMAKLKYLENDSDNMQIVRLFTDALKEDQYNALMRIFSVATQNELTYMYLIAVLASHFEIIDNDIYANVITHLSNNIRLTPKLANVIQVTPVHFIEILTDAKSVGLFGMSAVMILVESCLKIFCNTGTNGQISWKTKHDLRIASNDLTDELQFLLARTEPVSVQESSFWSREQETFDTPEHCSTSFPRFFPLCKQDSYKPTSPINGVSTNGDIRICDASLDDLIFQQHIASEGDLHGLSDTAENAPEQFDFFNS